MVLVPSTGLSVAGARNQRCRKKAPTPRAVAFNMMEEMTSLTPRYALSSPGIDAHAAPTSIATRKVSRMCSGAGSSTAAAAAAPNSAASLYCPSTPMLNRFILKPMATATPEM